MTLELQVEQNIRKFVVAAKKQGTTAMSLECLFQCTPTPKMGNLSPSQYKNLFAKIANKVAKSFILEA